MLVNIQHLDANCFHILGSIKASPSIGVSIPPLENLDSIKKHGDEKKKVFGEKNLNVGSIKHFSRVYRKPHDTKKGDVYQRSQFAQLDLKRNPDVENRLNNSSVGKNKFDEVKNGDRFVKKEHSKCLTKWANYGGCIPAILEALETVKDLDEAFKPWQDDLNNKERSIILKEQSNWECAFEIFEWFKKKGCYEINVIHYNIMIRVLGRARKWSLVEGMWDEMMDRGISPTNSTYGTLIDVYSKGGCKEKAIYWMNLMNKQGMEPDEVTMGTVVQMYKKLGEFRKAEEFFLSWSSDKSLINNAETYPSSRVSLNAYTYNNLIDTYGKAGNLVEASRTFKKMLSDGIAPNTITFNTMIHICGNSGDLQEVASLIQKMEELRCPFDTRTFNILISLHAKQDNIELAASYFAKMKEARLEPDHVSYRTLLYAFSIRHMVSNAEKLVSEMDEKGLEIDEFTQSSLTRMYIEDGKIEKSWLWFKRFHFKGNMTSECYAANIDAFGERGYVTEAEKAFNLRLEKENITVLEFNVMIKAYGIGKKYDQACKLFDSMNHYGVIPDKCSYNSLVQMLASADLPHVATPYLKKMYESRLVLDCVPYCAVISSFAKLGHLEKAEELYKEMIEHNVQADIIVYGVLINAFAEIGNVKKAAAYIDSMKNSGLQMNVVICSSLIKLYTKFGYLKEAQETYKTLQSSDTGPDVFSSNCMIDLYSERSMVNQAEEIFETMKKEGTANEFSFAMMLCMYKKIGMIDKAVQIAKLMREVGVITDLLSFNNVIGLYAMDGRVNEAIETFKAMIELSIKPDDSTFMSLGALLIQFGVSKNAVGKLEAERKKDSHAGLKAWMSTLSLVFDEDEL